MKNELACPRCGDPFDDCMAVGHAAEKHLTAPVAGSILVCYTCGELSIMDEAGKARFMSDEEARELPPFVVQFLATREDCRQTVRRRQGFDPFGRTAGEAG